MNGSPERDQSIERLLRQSPNAPHEAVVTEACLDAETVAAWVDRGLSAAALEAAQLHVADCARCQSLIGALARTDIVAAQLEPAPAAAWWRLGWLVPLTAAAAAMAIWVAMPADTNDRRPAPPPLDADSAGRSQNRVPMTDSAASATTEASSATRSFSVELERAPAAAPQEPRKDAAQFEADTTTATAATGRARRESADEFNATDRRNAASSSSASALAAVPPPPPTPDGGRQERTVAGQLAGPLAATAPAAPSAAESVATANAVVPAGAAFARVASIEVASPDSQVRWRVVGAGLERTTDGGARWEAQRTGNTTELTSGSAPSPSICWMVGRSGVVLLSIDGSNWRRLPFPEGTDLSAVRATDARTASVTTVNGLEFRTTDAGATWSR